MGHGKKDNIFSSFLMSPHCQAEALHPRKNDPLTNKLRSLSAEQRKKVLLKTAAKDLTYAPALSTVPEGRWEKPPDADQLEVLAGMNLL